MRVECPSCGAVYQVPRPATRRRARCKACQGVMVIPGADEVEAGAEEAPPPEPERSPRDPADRRRAREEARRLPGAGWAVVVISLLEGLLLLPGLLVVSMGGLVLLSESETLPVQGLFLVLGVAAPCLCLLGGAVGMILRRTWGWWALALIQGFLLLYNLKMISPVLGTDLGSDFSQALLLLHAPPIVLSALSCLLLFLPAVRRVFGMGPSEARPRRRRVVR